MRDRSGTEEAPSSREPPFRWSQKRWVICFAANAPICLVFGLAFQGELGWTGLPGMIAGMASLWALGAAMHAAMPRWMLPLHYGSAALALTQAKPVLQFVIGAVAISRIGSWYRLKLFDDGQRDVTLAPEIANPLSFLVVLGTGLPLMLLALLSGLILQQIFRGTEIESRFLWPPPARPSAEAAVPPRASARGLE